MKTTTKYKGVTTEISDLLLEPIKIVKDKPKKSLKFGDLSLYYDGIYYFPKDIKESEKRENLPFEIQGVYYSHKWYQDTFYITEDFKNFLIQSIN